MHLKNIAWNLRLLLIYLHKYLKFTLFGWEVKYQVRIICINCVLIGNIIWIKALINVIWLCVLHLLFSNDNNNNILIVYAMPPHECMASCKEDVCGHAALSGSYGHDSWI